jgi:hypothetical protein
MMFGGCGSFGREVPFLAGFISISLVAYKVLAAPTPTMGPVRQWIVLFCISAPHQLIVCSKIRPLKVPQMMCETPCPIAGSQYA